MLRPINELIKLDYLTSIPKNSGICNYIAFFKIKDYKKSPWILIEWNVEDCSLNICLQKDIDIGVWLFQNKIKIPDIINYLQGMAYSILKGSCSEIKMKRKDESRKYWGKDCVIYSTKFSEKQIEINYLSNNEDARINNSKDLYKKIAKIQRKRKNY